MIGNRFQLAAEQIAHKNKINNHNFISSDKKSTMNHHTFNIILAAHINNNHTINRNILYRQNIKMLYSFVYKYSVWENQALRNNMCYFFDEIIENIYFTNLNQDLFDIHQ